MEEIVLLETKKAFPEKEVFKLKFAIGEFDMVIHDPEKVTCEMINERRPFHLKQWKKNELYI